MSSWDERFRQGEYPRAPEPHSVLRRYVEAFPDGRALDVATGTGRNAVFLADRGYEVDAIDQSGEGLRITRERARERGADLNPIQADLGEYAFPESAYDVITISYYRAVDRLPDIKDALRPGGYLFYEHHLRTSDGVDRGPSGDRYRFRPNELLHSCLDLTVLFFEAVTETADGRTGATARVVARNSHGGAQRYPAVR